MIKVNWKDDKDIFHSYVVTSKDIKFVDNMIEFDCETYRCKVPINQVKSITKLPYINNDKMLNRVKNIVSRLNFFKKFLYR